MPKSNNSFFVAFSFAEKHVNTKFQKISLNSLDSVNLLNFCQFWLFFGQKRPKSKNNFFVAFSFVGKHLHTNSRKFHPRFGFWQFSSFFVNLGFFLVKKRPKDAKIEEQFFVAFSFAEKHVNTKF